MKKRSTVVLTGIALSVVLLAAGTFGVARSRSTDDKPAGPAGNAVGPQTASLGPVSGASLDKMITGLQGRLATAPGDYVSWSTLGLAYVQQAKVTVNPEFYPRAQGALDKSIQINKDDNFLAYAGLSALAGARHEFAAAKKYAEQGLAINGSSAILYGALSDAEIQLGDYTQAFDAVQKMVDLRPDTPSLSRASYTWELRGNIDQARKLMQRALDGAPTASARAFALFYLGELSLNEGDANAALGHYRAALEASPDDSQALAGKAKAEAALGQNLTALDDYAEVVNRTPEPSYIIEYGELLQSLGRTADAQEQYRVFAATQKLFEANGVKPDSTQTLFYANHGEPERALASAELGIGTRPFLVMHDAYAWALHVNGRDQEALKAIDKAMALGTRNALFHYHAGMIKYALGDLDGARTELKTALDMNPNFNPLDAPIARKTLADLGGLP